jgi:hypothetical protein
MRDSCKILFEVILRAGLSDGYGGEAFTILFAVNVIGSL